MVNRAHESQKLTYRVSLPGGQERLREIILYVAREGETMSRFGLIKLNKIIWRADFTAFAERGSPVTGRAYQRLQFGPAPIEMRPLLAEMAQDGLISVEHLSLGIGADGIEAIEHRVHARTDPSLRWFSQDDLDFVRRSVEHYRNMTGMESSDDSHGTAWRTRLNGDPMPYESAILSDAPVSIQQLQKAAAMAAERGWKSQ